MVISDIVTPMIGQSYNLTCNVSGAVDVTTYKWTNNGHMLNETGPTLSLSALRLSNAGRFMCKVFEFCSHDDLHIKRQL